MNELQVVKGYELVSAWLGGQQSRHTRRAYEHIAKSFVEEGVPFDEVTIITLQAWVEKVGGSDSKRQLYSACIKSLFSFLYKSGALRFNPAELLKVCKVEDHRSERILTVDEVGRIIGAVTTTKHKLLVYLLYYGGLRVSEACELEWRNVRGDVITVFGKGGKTRYVGLPSGVSDTIAHERGEDSEKVVPMSAVGAWKAIKTLARKAGLSSAVSPHFLRHSHGSHSLEAGATLACIRDTLGHESIATTSKYLHVKAGESSGRYL